MPPSAPDVASTGPPGAWLVELLIFNGSPFMDHWAYWVCTRSNPDVGLMVNVTGDVRNGFKFEAERSLDFNQTGNRYSKRIPLQWIDDKYFDEAAMFNNGVYECDNKPVCGFEKSAYKVKAPEKSLNSVDGSGPVGKKVTQRNCQTWIVESADQLARDLIFSQEVVSYLYAIKQ